MSLLPIVGLIEVKTQQLSLYGNLEQARGWFHQSKWQN
ncbi:hypothetical protein NSTC731_04348 [Nostoc sp. DSM 114167]|jgi:hypothetical protein